MGKNQTETTGAKQMNVMMCGRQTWCYWQPPVIVSTGTVVGPKEGSGPLGECFDVIHNDNWLGGSSFEQAEQMLLAEACGLAISKGGLTRDDINCHFSGDLINQITPSSFTAKSLGIPYIGLFGACSTSMEGLALASLMVASGAVNFALASTSSHTNTAEKQFRYPNEYGAQKCDTAQTTVMGAGAVVVGKKPAGGRVRVVAATIGRVVDLGVADPFNMGAVMAPAAADTIQTHLEERGLGVDYYDLIMTGDLGKVGQPIMTTLLEQRGLKFPPGCLQDAGKLIYPDEAKFLAGGSGCGCMATVGFGHVVPAIEQGKLRRVLLVATGALLSPLTVQQKQSIPGIAHAVALERLDD